MRVRPLRRRDVLALAGSALAWPGFAGAQTERMRLVGLVSTPAATPAQSMLPVFVKRLHELGWTEEQNLRIELRQWTSGERGQLKDHAKELVALKPDIIVARSSPEISAVREQTAAIPIVFPFATDPVASGFVSNLARPGGNITGFMNFEYPMAGKWLEILVELAPSVRRAGAIHNPANVSSRGYLAAMESVARAARVELVPISARGTAETVSAVETFAREPGSGLVVFPDFVFGSRAGALPLLDAAQRLNTPAVYPFTGHVALGGLAGFGASYPDLWRRTAEYVDLILRGAKPGDLPIQVPTKFELAINLKTAKALGLTVPPSLLVRADEVIE